MGSSLGRYDVVGRSRAGIVLGRGLANPDCIFVGVVNAADDALRCRELSRSFTRIALPSKTIPHGSALIGLPRGPQADRTE